MNANELVDGFAKLVEKVKVHRTKIDAKLNEQHQDTIKHINRLRDKRDADYQKEYDELIAYVKEFQAQLEEKERKLERVFKIACAECYDKMRAELY